ncbi:hypothetical protein BKA61DRAFT_51335 [Leptodontidium sp. MPI-SDFR-AT-0119]|nr:hypothetical protein BKA61DRAFT_51335 [Leptodontidium sp. MPI-SDFR-AT-0119]
MRTMRYACLLVCYVQNLQLGSTTPLSFAPKMGRSVDSTGGLLYSISLAVKRSKGPRYPSSPEYPSIDPQNPPQNIAFWASMGGLKIFYPRDQQDEREEICYYYFSNYETPTRRRFPLLSKTHTALYGRYILYGGTPPPPPGIQTALLNIFNFTSG